MQAMTCLGMQVLDARRDVVPCLLPKAHAPIAWADYKMDSSNLPKRCWSSMLCWRVPGKPVASWRPRRPGS